MDIWMSEMANHSTPTPRLRVVPRVEDDSGYLSATPDSFGFTRPAWSYLRQECPPSDQLYTPDPVRNNYLIKQTPFPMSTEESIDLNDIDMTEMDPTNEILPTERFYNDSSSLYQDLNLDPKDDEYNDNRLETVHHPTTPSVCTAEGFTELQMKLETIARAPKYCSWRQRLAPDLSDRPAVDFLLYLGQKSDHSLIVSKILSYLDAESLSCARDASAVWRKVILGDKRSQQRLKKVPKRLASVEKENHVESKKQKQVMHHMGTLVHIENIERKLKPDAPVSPPVSPGKVRFHRFVKAGRSLRPGDVQTTCPLCNSPSRVDSGTQAGQCLGVGCRHEFCAQCRRNIHSANETCRLISSPRNKKHRHNPMVVGSKQSRRNLKRL